MPELSNNNYLTITLKGELVNVTEPLVMGIVNITPDSFYDGGNYLTNRDIVRRCEKLLSEGAAIIDVGAYSSRPGAEDISSEEEWRRLENALSVIRKEFPDANISLDTFRSELARRAVNEYGVDMINDISGGVLDEKMFETIARLRVPYILMHMQGRPQTMQKNPEYGDVVADISLFFSNQVNRLRELGVCDIILDPGFGFGKTITHNYTLLARFMELQLHRLPLLAGVSRKSMITKVLHVDAADSLNGTTVLNTVALLNGANILRVHDVKEALDCVKLVKQLKQENLYDVS